MTGEVIKVKGIRVDDPMVERFKSTQRALKRGRGSSRMIVGPRWVGDRWDFGRGEGRT